MVALNKSDLSAVLVLPPSCAALGSSPLRVSAHTGEGVAALRAALAAALGSGSGDDPAAALVTNARHIDALAPRAGRDRGSRRAPRSSAPGEIVAGEIRVALAALGEVTGEAVAPDLLARIFARFCIGK